jgi:hypothetical protein
VTVESKPPSPDDKSTLPVAPSDDDVDLNDEDTDIVDDHPVATDRHPHVVTPEDEQLP